MFPLPISVPFFPFPFFPLPLPNQGEKKHILAARRNDPIPAPAGRRPPDEARIKRNMGLASPAQSRLTAPANPPRPTSPPCQNATAAQVGRTMPLRRLCPCGPSQRVFPARLSKYVVGPIQSPAGPIFLFKEHFTSSVLRMAVGGRCRQSRGAFKSRIEKRLAMTDKDITDSSNHNNQLSGNTAYKNSKSLASRLCAAEVALYRLHFIRSLQLFLSCMLSSNKAKVDSLIKPTCVENKAARPFPFPPSPPALHGPFMPSPNLQGLPEGKGFVLSFPLFSFLYVPILFFLDHQSVRRA